MSHYITTNQTQVNWKIPHTSYCSKAWRFSSSSTHSRDGGRCGCNSPPLTSRDSLPSPSLATRDDIAEREKKEEEPGEVSKARTQTAPNPNPNPLRLRSSLPPATLRRVGRIQATQRRSRCLDARSSVQALSGHLCYLHRFLATMQATRFLLNIFSLFKNQKGTNLKKHQAASFPSTPRSKMTNYLGRLYNSFIALLVPAVRPNIQTHIDGSFTWHRLGIQLTHEYLEIK